MVYTWGPFEAGNTAATVLGDHAGSLFEADDSFSSNEERKHRHTASVPREVSRC